MTKLVLLHRHDSKYEDQPDAVYDFPASYLKAAQEAVGDWVIYCEPVKAGPRGYFAVAKVAQIVPKQGAQGRFLALMEPGSYLELDQTMPRLIDGRPLEEALIAPDGGPKKGGLQQLAVRRITEADFARIVGHGLPEDLVEQEANRYSATPHELAEAPQAFQRPIVERLTRRKYRDVAFRRKVRAAYDYRCAVSGLKLRNGGGRPEVQAAHIKPVERDGSDAVTNGLALSGTLHWMFDRGLISVAEDNRTLLVSDNKVPGDVVRRLIRPEMSLCLPEDRRNWPHPANLKWHRENVFGQVLTTGPTPWD